MPNYCNGVLSITCSEELLEQIINYVRSEDNEFDFDKIIPMPEHIYRGPIGPEEEKKYGKDNWYDWSNKFWGTKWNACDATLDGNDYYFETAWSPCSPVIKVLAECFPEATFRYTYSEPGCCYCGVEEYKNGELVYSLTGEYYEYFAFKDENQVYEEIQFKIPDRIIKCPDEYRSCEKYIPMGKHEGAEIGELYYHNRLDDSVGYEIIADIAYKGEKPSYWW